MNNDAPINGDTPTDAKASKETGFGGTAKRRVRSKKYVSTRGKIDKTKKYPVAEAITLIKSLSYSSFDGTITLDGVIKEIGKVGTFSLPHSTGKTVKVEIVTDEIIEKIAAGNIDFDVLVTTPAFMPKLAKYARVLGPKGLMPNPKSGTVTSKPKEKKAELEKGSFDLKTQKKEPVIHVNIGKVSMTDKKLAENINYLLGKLKDKMLQATISATMSPSVKLELVK
ncbi:50S ribosomal protein L1 [Patescibacteria group bacterium]|nr:50S ribosomal protein L1 [Patescibacteria group bacterium]